MRVPLDLPVKDESCGLILEHLSLSSLSYLTSAQHKNCVGADGDGRDEGNSPMVADWRAGGQETSRRQSTSHHWTVPWIVIANRLCLRQSMAHNPKLSRV